MSTMQHSIHYYSGVLAGKGARPLQDANQTPKRHVALDISQFPPQPLGAGAIYSN